MIIPHQIEKRTKSVRKTLGATIRFFEEYYHVTLTYGTLVWFVFNTSSSTTVILGAQIVGVERISLFSRSGWMQRESERTVFRV